jgi:hypothetical protein
VDKYKGGLDAKKRLKVLKDIVGQENVQKQEDFVFF